MAKASLALALSGRGEMAYAAGLGPVGGDTVGVRIPPPAPVPEGSGPFPIELAQSPDGCARKITWVGAAATHRLRVRVTATTA